jgi:hypothetical protein
MTNSSAHPDHSLWGRQRLVFLQLGYIFLTMRSTRLDEATRSLIDNMDLSSRIGPISIKMASADERPGLMLAERIYTYVLSQDEKAFESAKLANDENFYLFKDPLVYSRYASSLFLQERFGQAKTVLDQILFTDDLRYTVQFGNFDKFDVSLYEVLMRHSQYIFLRYYSEDEKIVDNVKLLVRDFEPVLADMGKHIDEFDQKHFRAVCWYFLCSEYIGTLNIITPSFMILHREAVENYLKKHIESGAIDTFKSKPEIMCAKYLLTKRDGSKKGSSIESITKDLRTNINYPAVVSACFLNMIERVDSNRLSINDEKPKVFFSYSHHDKKLAEKIVNYLIDSGIDILSDKQFITGDSLMSGMQKAIQSAEICIIFVSKHYLESSGWLEKERETIFSRNVDGDTEVVVLTHGVSVSEIKKAQPMLVNNLLVQLNEERLDGELYRVSNQIQTLTANLRKKKRPQAPDSARRRARLKP